MTSARIAPTLAVASVESFEVAPRRQGELAAEPVPLAFSVARVLLVVALIGAPLAFGAVVTWAWMALGLVASLALFLWATGSVWQGRLDLIWSPLYIPLAIFFLLGLAQYWAQLPLDRFETRQALVLLGADLTFFFLAAQLFASADSRTWRLFGPTVLLFAGSLGLFAILQIALGTRQIYGIVDTPSNAHFGPYVNPNHYAGLMEMLIPVAVLYIAGRYRRSSVRHCRCSLLLLRSPWQRCCFLALVAACLRWSTRRRSWLPCSGGAPGLLRNGDWPRLWRPQSWRQCCYSPGSTPAGPPNTWH